MDVVFSHVWGVWWWRCSHTNTTADNLRTNRCFIGKAPARASELNESKVHETRIRYTSRGFPRDLPIDLISGTPVARSRLRLIKVRQWTGPVPLGAICTAGNAFVCSPEFCFVLVAGDVKHICQERLSHWQYIVILVELGCELCGTYSKQESVRGFKDRRAPLIGSWQLFSFAGLMANERGGSLAHEAIRWVIDGLNSPMETVLYMMLCLPRAWGGLGLYRPRSNWILDVPTELWRGGRQHRIIPDLYWPEYALIAEYFGEDAHEGREVPDVERQEIAQDMGYKVVTFWKEDLLDLKKFNAKARVISHYMGRELPEATESFAALQSRLQQMLLRHQRWI